MSAGIRSGVNWTRPYSSASAYSLEQDVTLRDKRDRAETDRVFLSDDRLDELLAQPGVELRRGHGGGLLAVGHHAFNRGAGRAMR
jgi:hypothetical protein